MYNYRYNQYTQTLFVYLNCVHFSSGRPSNPARPTVTSDGATVTVVLSTDYPGTERMRSGSMFSFQLQFTKDGRSARQSDTPVPFSSSGLNNTVNTTYQGVLSGGSYTVRVTAVNEHGSSESVVSDEFVVTGVCGDMIMAYVKDHKLSQR